MQFRQVPAAIPCRPRRPVAESRAEQVRDSPHAGLCRARQGPLKESGLAPSNPLGDLSS